MIALRNLLRRRVRTVLTILGVAVGVATVVAMMSVSRGFRTQFNTIFAAGDAHLVLTLRDAADPMLSFLPEELALEIEQQETVLAAHNFVWGVQQVPGRKYFILFGITEGTPFTQETRIVEGVSIHEAQTDLEAMVIGSTIVELLGLSLDDEFNVGGIEFEIVGIYEAAIPLYEGGGLIRLPIAQRICGLEGKSSTVLVQLVDHSPEGVIAGGAAIESAFSTVRASEPARLTESFDQFDLSEDAVKVFSILAILVGGIGVMNTMLMSVFERTREIGVLQAIGWSKWLILKQILLEGILVCLLGGVFGALLGVLAVETISNMAALAWVSGDYSPAVFGQAVGVAVAMGIVGSIYPAYRAVRITPIAALRYE